MQYWYCTPRDRFIVFSSVILSVQKRLYSCKYAPNNNKRVYSLLEMLIAKVNNEYSNSDRIACKWAFCCQCYHGLWFLRSLRYTIKQRYVNVRVCFCPYSHYPTLLYVVSYSNYYYFEFEQGEQNIHRLPVKLAKQDSWDFV